MSLCPPKLAESTAANHLLPPHKLNQQAEASQQMPTIQPYRLVMHLAAAAAAAAAVKDPRMPQAVLPLYCST
jgi:hypothetical protein